MLLMLLAPILSAHKWAVIPITIAMVWLLIWGSRRGLSGGFDGITNGPQKYRREDSNK